MQDEAICVANARLRKGIYTPKGVRGVYTYTGSHSKTIVFGLITLGGEGFFRRYGSFTGKEFVGFLKAACERFGKVLMITGGAPQHRSKFVREEIGRLDGVELQFLPPGCPDLNAIEEVWRQTKHAVLDVPYVRFSSTCGDIDKWLRSSLPKLDIEKYFYRKAWASACRRTGDRAHAGTETVNGRPTTLHGSERTSILGQEQQAAWKKFGNPVFGPASNLALFTKLYSAVYAGAEHALGSGPLGSVLASSRQTKCFGLYYACPSSSRSMDPVRMSSGVTPESSSISMILRMPVMTPAIF